MNKAKVFRKIDGNFPWCWYAIVPCNNLPTVFKTQKQAFYYADSTMRLHYGTKNENLL